VALGEVDLSADLYAEDFADVRGQEGAKRAIEVAAAGGHNLLMIGSPGSGKTMLARRIPSVLPSMSFDEALEVTRIYSVSGMLAEKGSLIRQRPFRLPHHSVSNAGLIGGGSVPRPGEVSLAHNGVLFLDELPEFRKDVLELLRQPLEDGRVTIARATATLSYPSRVMLICAMNPCPCGYYQDPVKPCSCADHQIRRYLSRISGPLLDRIDIHIEVPRVEYNDLENQQPAERSSVIRARVQKARDRQLARLEGTSCHNNAQMSSKTIRQFCQLSKEAKDLLRAAFIRLGLSARAHDRILKVARTIADLAESDRIEAEHLAEAISYRSLDKKLWGH
ncbi:MAG: YifB family Mg chelatase-like AAA ATPase, partial [Bacillota bacterium]